MRRRIPLFIFIAQSILFLVHLFLYETWIHFWGTPAPRALLALRIGFALLSVLFLTATLLAWRSWHAGVRLYYTAAAVWLGTMSFLLLAACLAWILYGAVRAFGLPMDPRLLATTLLGLALLASLYGVVNAAWTRIRRVTVKLPNLPVSWRGRTAALVSDLHLGTIRGVGFVRRIVRTLAKLQPEVVFIAGDLYDGTAADLDLLARPWAELSVPLGAYYVTGNHEEFRDRRQYIEAVSKSGVRVLNNETVNVDGVRFVGVHFGESTQDQRLRGILREAALDPNRSSILLTHAPDRLRIAEEEGVSLQLSGHTHGGQFFPFTWIASRVYGPYVHGLNRLGRMLVYTAWGVGTWGPPLRLGTRPEIVLIEFA